MQEDEKVKQGLIILVVSVMIGYLAGVVVGATVW